MICERISLPTGCSMDVFAPRPAVEGAPRLNIVICPGGGYNHLSPRESEPVALRFAAMGFNAFVVNYRVLPHLFPAALQDIACAVAYVRQRAEDFHGHPDRIALMGFSAGGHAAASLGVRWQEENLFTPLSLTPEQIRPSAMVLCYPVITAGEYAHRGSFCALTGSEALADHAAHSIETLVGPHTPPTFLWHTWEDGGVPVENSLLMAAALHHSGIPAELHVFPRGGHGVGLADETTAMNPAQILPEVQIWPEMAARFLRDVLK